MTGPLERATRGEDLAHCATLLRGRPEERVRAAWGLGLSLGRGAHGLLRRQALRDRSPGVRRHLAVMLAGFGDVPTLIDLAERDPRAMVRATAAAQLARLGGRDRADLQDLLGRWLHEQDPPVRAAIIDHLPDEAPAWLWRLADAQLEHPDVRVRRAATRNLAARVQGAEALERRVEDRLDQERDPLVQRSLRAAMAAVGRPVTPPKRSRPGLRYPLLPVREPGGYR